MFSPSIKVFYKLIAMQECLICVFILDVRKGVVRQNAVVSIMIFEKSNPVIRSMGQAEFGITFN